MLLRAQHESGQGAPLHEFRQVRAAGPRPDRPAAASESKHTSTLLARHVNERAGWFFAQLLFQGTAIKIDAIHVVSISFGVSCCKRAWWVVFFCSCNFFSCELLAFVDNYLFIMGGFLWFL